MNHDAVRYFRPLLSPTTINFFFKRLLGLSNECYKLCPPSKCNVCPVSASFPNK